MIDSIEDLKIEYRGQPMFITARSQERKLLMIDKGIMLKDRDRDFGFGLYETDYEKVEKLLNKYSTQMY